MNSNLMNNRDDFTILNNPDSEMYKVALCRTQNYIDARLPISKQKGFHDNTRLMGTVDELVDHLSYGQGTNLVKNFFKFPIKKCDFCCNESKTLDRAHCNNDGCDRPSLLKQAIEFYYIDENTPIVTGNVMYKFIELHRNQPLYLLCKPCHSAYDKKR